MAHFAELDAENTVIRVICVSNDVLMIAHAVEDESLGVIFCKSLYGENTKWVQTSYNKKFRGNYASTGYTYFEDHNIFMPPKPYESWVLNLSTATYDPPIPKPDDDKKYKWDESIVGWVELT